MPVGEIPEMARPRTAFVRLEILDPVDVGLAQTCEIGELPGRWGGG
ncbi:MAG TPA: hypothetical protein VJ086_01585 [Rubrobacteraceae bacterium]|nr:hypothetical protein [Rubrobacteraceae bacterium]